MGNDLEKIANKISDDRCLISTIKHATVEAQDEIRVIAKEQLGNRLDEVYAYPHSERAEWTRRYERGGLFSLTTKHRPRPDRELYHINIDVSKPTEVTFTLYGKVPKQNPYRYGGNLIDWVETGKNQGGVGGNGKKLDGQPRPFMTNTDKDLDTIKKPEIENAITQRLEEMLSKLGE